MTWFTRKKATLRNIVAPKERPELWIQCPECEQMLVQTQLAQALHVCTYCQHHFRMPLAARLEMFFEHHEAIPLRMCSEDPIQFTDSKNYKDRLKEARAKTKDHDALRLAKGMIGRHNAVMAIMNFDFIGGSMGACVGENLIHGADIAIAEGRPYIVITSSGGARMQEGIFSLAQMSRTMIFIQNMRQARLPYIVILTHPTTGGVAASFAFLGDIIYAEPGATIGFTGERVIKSTLGVRLPDGFQRSSFHHNNGFVDAVVPRSELKTRLIHTLDVLCG